MEPSTGNLTMQPHKFWTGSEIFETDLCAAFHPAELARVKDSDTVVVADSITIGKSNYMKATWQCPLCEFQQHSIPLADLTTYLHYTPVTSGNTVCKNNKTSMWILIQASTPVIKCDADCKHI